MKFSANHKETDKYTMIFKIKDRKRMTDWVSEWAIEKEKTFKERRETETWHAIRLFWKQMR